MKPEVDQILTLGAQQVMGGLAPLLPTSFAQGSAALQGFMMMLSAQEYDRAADIRVAENDDMRALFLEAAPVIADAGLRAELNAAAALREISLKISVLNEVNYALRHTLIRLHAHAEERGLRQIEARIWIVLKASADRRLLKLA